MGWARVEGRLRQHPKIVEACASGPDAGWLWTCGLSYSADYSTHGIVPKSAIPQLAPGLSPRKANQAARRLVEVGLWQDTGQDYVFHDWSTYNQPQAAATAADLDDVADPAERRRILAARRAREYRDRQRDASVTARDGPRDAERDGQRDASVTDSVTRHASPPLEPHPITETEPESDTPTVGEVVGKLAASGVVEAAIFDENREKLPRNVVESLTDLQLHAYRKVTKNSPVFSKIQAGFFDRIRRSAGEPVLTEALIRLAGHDPAALAGVKRPTAYLERIIDDVQREAAEIHGGPNQHEAGG